MKIQKMLHGLAILILMLSRIIYCESTNENTSTEKLPKKYLLSCYQCHSEKHWRKNSCTDEDDVGKKSFIIYDLF